MERFDLTWIPYEIKYHNNKRKEKKTHKNYVQTEKRYSGRQLLIPREVNKKIFHFIETETPCFVGRVGGNEMNIIAYSLRHKLFPFRTDAREECLRDLSIMAGFFPQDMELGQRFVDLNIECTKELDIVGAWNNYMEEWFLHRYAHEAEVTWLHSLEPWNLESIDENNKPWTYALEGKKVLVIHPFDVTIKNQYNNHRDKLFKDVDSGILPEFELITLRSVQSIGGGAKGYNNWFEAYDYMLSECKKIDFDVAIIGCGAYGFPLAAEIKKMRKCAIHLGGVTQLLFGIQGKRWESYGGVYDTMVNEYWTRPSEDEINPTMKTLEGGCYC